MTLTISAGTPAASEPETLKIDKVSLAKFFSDVQASGKTDEVIGRWFDVKVDKVELTTSATWSEGQPVEYEKTTMSVGDEVRFDSVVFKENMVTVVGLAATSKIDDITKTCSHPGVCIEAATVSRVVVPFTQELVLE